MCPVWSLRALCGLPLSPSLGAWSWGARGRAGLAVPLRWARRGRGTTLPSTELLGAAQREAGTATRLSQSNDLALWWGQVGRGHCPPWLTCEWSPGKGSRVGEHGDEAAAGCPHPVPGLSRPSRVHPRAQALQMPSVARLLPGPLPDCAGWAAALGTFLCSPAPALGLPMWLCRDLGRWPPRRLPGPKVLHKTGPSGPQTWAAPAVATRGDPDS